MEYMGLIADKIFPTEKNIMVIDQSSYNFLTKNMIVRKKTLKNVANATKFKNRTHKNTTLTLCRQNFHACPVLQPRLHLTNEYLG